MVKKSKKKSEKNEHLELSLMGEEIPDMSKLLKIYLHRKSITKAINSYLWASRLN